MSALSNPLAVGMTRGAKGPLHRPTFGLARLCRQFKATRGAMKTEQLARRRYKDRSGNSGVRFFAPGRTFIRVWFEDGGCYEYDETKPGTRHVDAMKRLAEDGRGLATYINQHVRGNYARKL